MFLTEMIDGSGKAWQCIDGRKQWQYIDKNVSESPPVSNEAIFITFAIEAKEH